MGVQQSSQGWFTRCCSQDDAKIASNVVDSPGASQRAMVKDVYANTITGKDSCCVTLSGVSGVKMGYNTEQLKQAVSDKSLGCGNPISFADLQPGETVVDLGCGAGLDCFLASQQVGFQGKVIGVDMTQEMLDAATTKALELGMCIEFRQGEIEKLPVDNESADAVISNCVINLSPDKEKVYSECFRVLRPGGRLCVSDVVATAVLPERLRTAETQTSTDKHTNTQTNEGAPTLEDVEPMLQKAGFVDISIQMKEESKEFIKDWMPGSGCENYIVSAQITAYKPKKIEEAKVSSGNAGG